MSHSLAWWVLPGLQEAQGVWEQTAWQVGEGLLEGLVPGRSLGTGPPLACGWTQRCVLAGAKAVSGEGGAESLHPGPGHGHRAPGQNGSCGSRTHLWPWTSRRGCLTGLRHVASEE